MSFGAFSYNDTGFVRVMEILESHGILILVMESHGKGFSFSSYYYYINLQLTIPPDLQNIPKFFVLRAFAHGAMGRRIDPSWGGPIELFLVPASAP